MSLGDMGPRGQRIWFSVMFGIVGFAVLQQDGDIQLAVGIVVVALMSVAYQIGRVVERDYIEEHKWDPESRVWKQKKSRN